MIKIQQFKYNKYKKMLTMAESLQPQEITKTLGALLQWRK